MFERYTEQARRAIFFSRFEASEFGSPYIEVEHLLLGLIRESPYVRQLFPAGAVDALRGKILAESGALERFSTSVDLPLSTEAKRTLTYGAEEARVPGSHIDTAHLFAGLLRVTPSLAHSFLREQVGDLDELLETVRRHLKQDAGTI